ARETIQDELHTEVLPGTEIMTDVGKEHFVRAEEPDQVLVPQPSQDPHDPLNWSPFWKFSTIFCVSTMTTLGDVIQFTGVTILILGFSNFFWAPVSTSFGRRLVYLASQVICLACHIIRAKASTYGIFMGACALNGIGAGPSEILQPTVIADIFFLHDRGTWNALYWVVYMGSLMIAPIIAGPMADSNFWWLNVGVTGLSIILGIFGFPETKWTRIDSIEAESGPREPVDTTQDKPSHSHADIEKTVGTPQQPQGEPAADAHLGKGTPSKLQWRLFQPNSSPLKNILLDIWTP
ncbi:hypothetical protein IL306_001044, partial [Fusarium sp. DS 682]